MEEQTINLTETILNSINEIFSQMFYRLMSEQMVLLSLLITLSPD